MPSQPFWFVLTWACVAWYAVVVVVVGWHGLVEIRQMIRNLEAGGSPERRLEKHGKPNAM